MVNVQSLKVDEQVRSALEKAYLTFDAPTPSAIEGCPCCISTRSTDALLTTPLCEIPGQTLWRYVSGAFLTVGNEQDFKYLLPRIFEVSLTDPSNANDPEIVLGKLSLSKWRSWSTAEQQAVEALIDAWFEKALSRDLADVKDGWIGMETESVMCGASRAGVKLERWFPRLLGVDAAPVLADMQERFPGNMSAFWPEAPLGLQEISLILSRGNA